MNIREIAKKAGVSPATVSRVMNGGTAVSLEKRQRVMEWIDKTEYRPSATARELAGARSRFIGVMLPDISNPFFAEILGKIEEEATLRGYSVIVNNTHGDAVRVREAINVYASRRVDGVLLCLDPREKSLLQYVLSRGIPAVSITQTVPKIDSIYVSMEKGGAMAADHLVDLGHERIAFIGERGDPKYLGFADELRRRGIPVDPELVIEIGDWKSVTGEDLSERIRNFIAEKRGTFTAVFAYNDVAALRALHELSGAGIRVPDDVALMGFDNIFISKELNPSLTSISQPTGELGRLALESLVGRLEGTVSGAPRSIRLEPRLIARESTRGACV